MPVMRTEPETFGHLLVDTFYPGKCNFRGYERDFYDILEADWAAHDLNLTLPAKVKLVAMDPFERFTYQGLNDLCKQNLLLFIYLYYTQMIHGLK